MTLNTILIFVLLLANNKVINPVVKLAVATVGFFYSVSVLTTLITGIDILKLANF